MRGFSLLLSLGLTGCIGLDYLSVGDTSALDDTAAFGSDESERTAIDLAGRLYVIAPSDLTLVEPPGLDALFQEAVNQNVLVYVNDQSADSLDLRIALAGADGGQNPCESVRTMPYTVWQNPDFSAGPGQVGVSFGGEAATLRHLSMAGTFDTDASRWHDGTLTAQLDARELGAALGGADACDVLENIGSACTVCDDGAERCFDIRFEGVVANESNKDFDTNPTCE